MNGFHLIVDWHCGALAVEVVGLLFKFNLVLPVFSIQGYHEVLKIMKHVIVFWYVLLVYVLFAAEILNLKVGLEEAVECLLLVELVLNLERQFFKFLLVAPNTYLDLLYQRNWKVTW